MSLSRYDQSGKRNIKLKPAAGMCFLLPVSYMTVAKAGRWSFCVPKIFFQNRLFKTRFSVGLNRKAFWKSIWRSRSKYFVNTCEKGSKTCVLTAYHMRRLFRMGSNRQRRRGNVNDLWIITKGLLKIAFPWPMQWGDFFRWDTAQNAKICRIK